MQPTIKFEKITTREELLTRAQELDEYLVLSCGNRYSYIKNLLHAEPAAGRKKVLVKYMARSGGEATIVRYL